MDHVKHAVWDGGKRAIESVGGAHFQLKRMKEGELRGRGKSEVRSLSGEKRGGGTAQLYKKPSGARAVPSFTRSALGGGVWALIKKRNERERKGRGQPIGSFRGKNHKQRNENIHLLATTPKDKK